MNNMHAQAEKMNSHKRIINQCRICEKPNLSKFLDLPDMPLVEGHKPAEETSFTCDMAIYWCPRCGTVQTQHDLDLSDYYGDYTYAVSSSETVKRFMEQFSRDVWDRFDLQKGDVVLEIGSSDGYQLSRFKALGAKVLGFEPGTYLANLAKEIGVETVIGLFDNTTVVPSSHFPARVVITQYTFDHLPDPVGFLRTILPVLDPEKGVVVIEVHDFEKIIQRCEACLFTHEHSIYPTVDSMAEILKVAGFRLVCADLVTESFRRGNSLIVAATPESSSILSTRTQRTPLLETLQHQDTYDKFSRQVQESHDRLAKHVRQMVQDGKKVAGYGAAGRGVNTLVIAGLGATDLTCIYDMNTQLHGLLMPGSYIPVRSPNFVFDDRPDEIIVFNYGYIQEIRKFLAPYLADGGKVTSMLDYLQIC
jgi:SAM-dependent methyltransferase